MSNERNLEWLEIVRVSGFIEYMLNELFPGQRYNVFQAVSDEYIFSEDLARQCIDSWGNKDEASGVFSLFNFNHSS